MQSYQVEELGRPLQLRVRENPVPTGREVLVRVLASGVCHTDVHVWHGYYDLGRGRRAQLAERGVVPPITPGHEVFGEIVAVGPDVRTARLGDQRLVHSWVFCGECEACRTDRELMCNTGRSIGIFRPGGFADHVLVEDERYLIEADGIDPAWAATLACSGLTAYSALKQLRHLLSTDALLIIGLGGLGLSAVNMARHVVKARIFGCDLDAKKCEVAERLGAERTFLAPDPQVVEKINAAAGFGIVGAVDFVGSSATWELALAVLRKGGTYVTAGMMGGELTVPLPTIVSRVLSIKPAYIGTLAEMKELVALVKEKSIAPIPIDRRPLAAVNEVLCAMVEGSLLGRTVLTP